MSSAHRVNPRIAGLGRHPFPRVAELLAGVEPPPGVNPIDLTIGEPRFPPPAGISAEVTAASQSWGRYPPNDGPSWFREAAASWLERRFGLGSGGMPADAVVPTAGAREALFQLGLLTAGSPGRNLFAMPTPHYAPCRAAAMMAGLEPLYLPSSPHRGYLPDLDVLDGERGDRTAILILCSPSNPEGAVAPPAYLRRAVELARARGFVLVVDECYSEIYTDLAPTGVLDSCWQARRPGEDPFAGVLAVNSLSKRSSAAGLRVGIVSGDRELIRGFVDLRAYCGGTTPIPNLAAAAALLADEGHVEQIRDSYRRGFAVADDVLAAIPGYRRPAAGMFLWLDVGDLGTDEQITQALWAEAALRVVPGSYLGLAGWDGDHPGRTHVRVSMVHTPEVLEPALTRLAGVLTDRAERFAAC